MKRIFKKAWKNGTKEIQIINYREALKARGYSPRLLIQDNAAKREYGDNYYLLIVTIGYTKFIYENHCLQGLKKEG